LQVQEKQLLKDVNLQVEKGEFISLVGSSGSGKSTLLKLCSSLLSPTHGTISFKNRGFDQWDLLQLRREISYCVQMPVLFGETVMDNIKFPYELRHQKISLTRCHELLEEFSLTEDILAQQNHQLSGGEKQRIALIRSLLFVPEVLLLDEVSSALDATNTKVVETLMAKLNRQGVTILWVTHDLEQSQRIANRRIEVEHGIINFKGDKLCTQQLQ
jgi:putative ABC transport system ATP-binding protein